MAVVGTAVEAAQHEVAGPEAASAASSGPSSGAKQQHQEAAVADAALLATQAREDCDAACQLLQPQQAQTTLGCAHLAWVLGFEE